MLRPLRGSAFLGRPLSVAEYGISGKTVKFLVAKRGKGTEEFALIQTGERCELTGPLGSAWEDFLPKEGITALIGGGVGIAPLAALIAEKTDYNFHFYAGFRNGFSDKREEAAMLGAAASAKKIIIAAEDGKNALKGRIVDFFDGGKNYAAVLSCGPQPMLKAVKARCEKAGLPCFLSLERRMACGVGACLGCTVRTANGNRRCCTDGPIFPAGELIFDE